MEWSDEGIVLSARRHGENAAVVALLTRGHGRHAGLVHGGAGRRARGLLQPGNRVRAHWRARLAEHLGTYRCEMVEAHAARVLDEPLALLALSAATALVDATLPEREPHPALFDRLAALLGALTTPGWAVHYVRWELALLAELGFGLDLASCAATGATDALVYVSPRSGRAVSAAAGAPWRARLLPLPAFLRESEAGPVPERDDLAAGFALTGYFLERHVFAPEGRTLPAARRRLVASLT